MSKIQRSDRGVLAGIVGIVVNSILGGAKLAMGIITGSVSVTADAVNNLGDACCSLGTAIGFKISSKSPDSDHPFGHRRLEYVIGVVISVVVLMAGAEFAVSSIEEIISPSPHTYSTAAVVIMGTAIGAKLILAIFYYRIGKSMKSVAISASVADSLQDAVLTAVALIGQFFPTLDGVFGLIIAVMVIIGGAGQLRASIDLAIGKKCDPETVREVTAIIKSREEVLSVHHLFVHDYGDKSRQASAHVEMYDTLGLKQAHDIADSIEKEVLDKCSVTLTLHIDPVETTDSELVSVRNRVRRALCEYNPALSCHDFQLRDGVYTFDVLIPFDLSLDLTALDSVLSSALPDIPFRYTAERG